nr:SIR2 family protein [uncultured Desulfuromonas sp.]
MLILFLFMGLVAIHMTLGLPEITSGLNGLANPFLTSIYGPMFRLSEEDLKGLREAAQRGTLIPFIGAGASRLAGSPDWNGHADKALKQFVENGKFSHAQLDQLQGISARVKLSIALALQDEHGLKIDHRAILQPNEKTDPKGIRLYSGLSKLGKTFVTTNYDEWLDEYLALPADHKDGVPATEAQAIKKSRKVFHNVDELIQANLNQSDAVIHLHGSILDPDNMIFTTQHYVKHYANDRSSGDPEKENRVLTFLEHLFKEKTVLFIGYGLEELEILEYVILKARRMVEGAPLETRHYLVQGFFSHQRELMLSMETYFRRECGIKLIPFLRDEKDWDMLLDVVDHLAEKVPASDLMTLQAFKEMEGLLDG